jgi:hypothetical protein
MTALIMLLSQVVKVKWTSLIVMKQMLVLDIRWVDLWLRSDVVNLR